MNLFKRLEPRRFNYQPRYSKPETEKHEIRFRSISSMDHRKNVKKPYFYLLIIILLAVYFMMTGHLKKAFKPIDITKDDVIGYKKDNQSKDQSE